MPETAIARRDILRGVTAATAASYSRVMGANDRVQLGLIGCGERGRSDTGKFLKTGQVDVTAVCDIYGEQIDKARQLAPQARNYTDHRKLLESKDVQAVLIGTPDHWHAETAIDALNAGKDVYVEKPLTLKIEEGPAIVKAARVNNRICQVGMQQRSGQHYIQARREYMDTNKLGKITLARTWWHGNSYHLRRAPASLQQKPSNLDWAHFLGPLKWRDYDPQQYFNWRAYLDFGGGQVTDLFTHWIDVVHMFMNKDVPISAVAAGGVYHYKDGRTAPDTINVLLEYPQRIHRHLRSHAGAGHPRRSSGILRHRRQALDRPQPLRVHPPPAAARSPRWSRPTATWTWTTSPTSWSASVPASCPTATSSSAIASAQASHLGNIAYMQKRRLAFDPIREEILPL